MLLVTSGCFKRGVTPITTHFNQGVYYYSKGDYEAAISEYRLALEEDVDDHRAQFNLAEALESQATRAERRDESERATALRAEAEEHYLALLASRPGHLRASVNLAARELDRGETEAAERRLQDAIERHPRSALPRVALAAHRLREGVRDGDTARVRGAMELLEEALARDPEHPDANVLMGHACSGLDRISGGNPALRVRAREAYERAVDRDGSDIGAMMGLARLERRADNRDRSISWLRRALYVHPDLLAAHLMLSEQLDERGDLEDATAHLWRARQLDDERRPLLADGEYRRRLLDLYRRLEERENAGSAP